MRAFSHHSSIESHSVFGSDCVPGNRLVLKTQWEGGRYLSCLSGRDEYVGYRRRVKQDSKPVTMPQPPLQLGLVVLVVLGYGGQEIKTVVSEEDGGAWVLGSWQGHPSAQSSLYQGKPVLKSVCDSP